YPAAVLVVPLALRRYRFALLVAGSTVAVNALALALYPDGLSRNLRATADALALSPPITAVKSNVLYSWSLYSLIPKTTALVLGPLRAKGLESPFDWTLSIVYVVALYFVVRRGRVPQWCWGPLVLATTQVLVPVSYTYTTVWASVAAIWYASGDL